ncbi:MAG: tRNA uridine-5-carboxymethylaminomethyl(34) synthesis enzyme MnmG [Flavobacteriales bacterium]
MFVDEYDVIVVGGGHAGCEAAAAAAHLGASVLLVTMNLQTLGQMSCNPAMGGIAKGQIVREIDALGGYSAVVTDHTMIQFKMLNRSKGPAMWSPRAQSDRMRFAEKWRSVLERMPHIDLYQEMVTDLLVERGSVVGVKTALGIEIKSRAVVLTNGTFLNGLIHIGEKRFGGGRSAEQPATGLTEQLVSLGFQSGRMKTGTPPRVDGRSLDYSKMTPDPGDRKPGCFSFSNTPPLKVQRDCHITYTTPEVHDTLRAGFDRSPMFNGAIQSAGPRYCPSIEDKINRFADRDRHPIFVEPEGWHTVEVYVNGFSTSLPYDVQAKALRKVPGFEKAKIFRPGYAIEYDYFLPIQLTHTLETKRIQNLYFAGQINGTTGYEEAACQGLVAGINAQLKISGQPPFVLRRDEAYIGVLIDDLITKGTEEPYRMFSSRAEYRLLLRQDNADLRLTAKAFALGLVGEDRLQAVEKKRLQTRELIDFMQRESIGPAEANSLLQANHTPLISQSVKADTLVKRPQIRLAELCKIPNINAYMRSKAYPIAVIEQAEIHLKYDGYIAREKENAAKLNRLEGLRIPADFDYAKPTALSCEAREKLKRFQPATIAQASRISGVSPSDISILLVYLGR